MFKGLMLRGLNTLAIATGLCFGLNSAILYMAPPINIQQGHDTETIEKFDGVSIELTENLKSGGFGSLSLGIMGYVNVFSPEQVMYVDKEILDKPLAQRSYIANHEYAHILQKEVIAKQVGGYPSTSNPWRSFFYYYKLLELDAYYASVMPELDEKVPSFTAVWGLEAMADCYAQRPKMADPLAYIGRKECTPEQRKIAQSLDSREWPVP